MANEKARNDLRWQKTEEAIMDAFVEELKERPLRKVSVSNLAKRARINKSTFYLHYEDIFDLGRSYARGLADELMDEVDCHDLPKDEPLEFAKRFITMASDPSRQGHRKLLSENALASVFMERLVQNLYGAIGGLLPANVSDEELKVRVTFIITGIMGVIQFRPEMESADIVRVLDSMHISFKRIE